VRPVPDRYSPTIYALFNPAAGVLTFSNAGVPLLMSGDGCRSLGEGGFPSGMFADVSYEIHSVQLAPGDAVLFATDGLHEMRNAQNEDLSGASSTKFGSSAAANPRTTAWIFFSTRRAHFPRAAAATMTLRPWC
jgi:serine phosphatase RsbU (regulator of sigma subunit)